MTVKELLNESEMHLRKFPVFIDRPVTPAIFENGGKWMRIWLNRLNGEPDVVKHEPLKFGFYGVFKYSVSILVFISSAWLMAKANACLIPLSVIAFYLSEIHFLFLFPLLIDGVNNPVSESIRITYRIGLLKALTIVMPVGFYMIVGLLNFSDPFRNWYKGCLAILIWYQHDVRNRI